MWLADTVRRLLGKVALRAGRRQLSLMHELAPHVRQVQRWVLHEKLTLHRRTRFGRDHGFASIESARDFRRAVPIAGYEYYQPYVNALAEGHHDALLSAHDKLLMFAVTSGTAGQPKLLPVTARFMDEYRRGWTMWGTQVILDHPETIENPPHWRPKRILQLSGAQRSDQTPVGIPCGAISGMMARMQRPVVRSIYCLPAAIHDIADADAKYYATLRVSLAETIGTVVTANPSTLLRLARLGDQWKSLLIQDLAEGTINEDFAIPGHVRQAMAPRCAPNPFKALQLEHIVARTGALYPKDYWPSLRLIGTWTGGTVGAYLDQLPQFYGPLPVRDIGLLASEGRMTIPLQDGTSAGLLDFFTNFFEFIPRDEVQATRPTVLDADELLVGQEYFVLLTTSAGLYRYDIRDLVRCVGHIGQAPLLEFLNKGDQFSSITGEKISEYQVVHAVRAATAEAALAHKDFVMAPCWGDPPCYVLLLEPADAGEVAAATAAEPGTWHRVDGPHALGRSHTRAGHTFTLSARRDADAAAPQTRVAVSYADTPSVRRVAQRVDELLAEQNCEYKSKRRSGRLGPVKVGYVPAGTWQAFDAQRLQDRGGTMEQYKHPFLIGELSFLQAVPGQSCDV